MIRRGLPSIETARQSLADPLRDAADPRGRKPADLLVQQATKIQLFIDGAFNASVDRIKKSDEYVSEWTGEIADEGEIGTAIGKAIIDYRESSGQVIWGMTIMIDKVESQR